MEARVQVIRRKISSSKKDCNERETTKLEKKNVFDFDSEEEEDECSKYSVSYLKKNIFIGLGLLLSKRV